MVTDILLMLGFMLGLCGASFSSGVMVGIMLLHTDEKVED